MNIKHYFLTFMLLVFCSLNAFSDDASVTFDGSTTNYTTFDEAWIAATACNTTASNKATITLLRDCETDTTGFVNAEDFLILNTSTFTLEFTDATGVYDINYINLNGGTLEIIGNGIITSGAYELSGTIGSSSSSGADALLVLDGPTIMNTRSRAHALCVNMHGDATFKMLSGTLKIPISGDYSYPLRLYSSGAKAELYSGTLSARGSYRGVVHSYGTVKLMPSNESLIFKNGNARAGIFTTGSSAGENCIETLDVNDVLPGYEILYGTDTTGTTVTEMSATNPLSTSLNTTLKYMKIGPRTAPPTPAASVTFDGSTTNYATFDEAWAAAISRNTTASSKAKITLLKDCETDTVGFTNTDDFLILDTKTFTLEFTAAVTDSDPNRIYLQGGSLEITGTGTIKGSTESTYIGILGTNSSSDANTELVLDGATIINAGSNRAHVVSIRDEGTFKMLRGTLYASTSGYLNYSLRVYGSDARAQLYSGTISTVGSEKYAVNSSNENIKLMPSDEPLIFKNGDATAGIFTCGGTNNIHTLDVNYVLPGYTIKYGTDTTGSTVSEMAATNPLSTDLNITLNYMEIGPRVAAPAAVSVTFGGNTIKYTTIDLAWVAATAHITAADKKATITLLRDCETSTLSLTNTDDFLILDTDTFSLEFTKSATSNNHATSCINLDGGSLEIIGSGIITGKIGNTDRAGIIEMSDCAEENTIISIDGATIENTAEVNASHVVNMRGDGTFRMISGTLRSKSPGEKWGVPLRLTSNSAKAELYSGTLQTYKADGVVFANYYVMGTIKLMPSEEPLIFKNGDPENLIFRGTLAEKLDVSEIAAGYRIIYGNDTSGAEVDTVTATHPLPSGGTDPLNMVDNYMKIGPRVAPPTPAASVTYEGTTIKYATIDEAWIAATAHTTNADKKATITLLRDCETDTLSLTNTDDFLILDTDTFTLNFTNNSTNDSKISLLGGSLELLGTGRIEGVTSGQTDDGTATGIIKIESIAPPTTLLALNGPTIEHLDVTFSKAISLYSGTFEMRSGHIKALGTYGIGIIAGTNSKINLYSGEISAEYYATAADGQVTLMPSDGELILSNASNNFHGVFSDLNGYQNSYDINYDSVAPFDIEYEVDASGSDTISATGISLITDNMNRNYLKIGPRAKAQRVSVAFDGNTTTYATIDQAWVAATACVTTADKKATITLLMDCKTDTTHLINTDDYLILNTDTSTLTLKDESEYVSKINLLGGSLEIVGTGTINGETPDCYSRGIGIIEIPDSASSTTLLILDGATIEHLGQRALFPKAIILNKGTFEMRSGSVKAITYSGTGILSEGISQSKIKLYSGEISASQQATATKEGQIALMPSNGELILRSGSSRLDDGVFGDEAGHKISERINYDFVSPFDIVYAADSSGSNPTTAQDIRLITDEMNLKYVKIGPRYVRAVSVTFDGDTTEYASIEEAWVAATACATTANNKATITLLNDCTTDTTSLSNADDFLILDTDTFTLNFTSETSESRISIIGGSLELIGAGTISGMIAYSAISGIVKIQQNASPSTLLVLDGPTIENLSNDLFPRVIVVFDGMFEMRSGCIKALTGDEPVGIMALDDSKIMLYSGDIFAKHKAIYKNNKGKVALMPSEAELILSSESVNVFSDANGGCSEDINYDFVLPFDIEYETDFSGSDTVAATDISLITDEMNFRYIKIGPRVAPAASVTFEGTTSRYATIDEAWTAATDCNTTADNKATIKLLNNCLTQTNLTNTDDFLILDTDTATLEFGAFTTSIVAIILDGGELEIIGDGTITSNLSRYGSLCATIATTLNSDINTSLVIDGPTIINTGASDSYSVLMYGSATFKMLSGTLKTTAAHEDAMPLYAYAGSNVELYSGTFYSNGNLNSTIVAPDRTIKFMPSNKPLVFVNGNASKGIFINEYKVENIETINVDHVAPGYTIRYGTDTTGVDCQTMKAGDPLSYDLNAVLNYIEIGPRQESQTASVTFNGNTNIYTTLSDAWTAAIECNTTAENKATIKLLRDCRTHESYLINEVDHLILDIDTATLAFAGNITDDGNIRLFGGSLEIVGTGKILGKVGEYAYQTGVVEIEPTASSTTLLVLNGPTIEAFNSHFPNAIVVYQGTFEMRSGCAKSVGGGTGLKAYYDAKVKLYSGELSSHSVATMIDRNVALMPSDGELILRNVENSYGVFNDHTPDKNSHKIIYDSVAPFNIWYGTDYSGSNTTSASGISLITADMNLNYVKIGPRVAPYPVASVTFEDTTTEYIKLEDAWAAAADCNTTADSKATIKLLRDCETDLPYLICNDDYIIFNIDTADLTFTSDGEDGNSYISLTKNGYLELKGTGTIKGGTANYTLIGIIGTISPIYSAASLVLDGPTVENVATQNSDAISMYGGTFEMRSGHVKSLTHDDGIGVALRLSAKGKLYSGEISAKKQAMQINVSGFIEIMTSDGELILRNEGSGGVFTKSSGIKISEGFNYEAVGPFDVDYATNFSGTDATTATDTKLVTDEMNLQYVKIGPRLPPPAIASVTFGATTTEYIKFNDAWTAATDCNTTADNKATIKLLMDCETESYGVKATNKFLILDTDTSTLTFTSFETDDNRIYIESGSLEIEGTGAIKGISNHGFIKIDNNYLQTPPLLVLDGPTIETLSGSIQPYAIEVGGGTFEMRSGCIKSQTDNGIGIFAGNFAKINLYSGEIYADKMATSISKKAVLMPSDGNLILRNEDNYGVFSDNLYDKNSETINYDAVAAFDIEYETDFSAPNTVTATDISLITDAMNFRYIKIGPRLASVASVTFEGTTSRYATFDDAWTEATDFLTNVTTPNNKATIKLLKDCESTAVGLKNVYQYIVFDTDTCTLEFTTPANYNINTYGGDAKLYVDGTGEIIGNIRIGGDGEAMEVQSDVKFKQITVDDGSVLKVNEGVKLNAELVILETADDTQAAEINLQGTLSATTNVEVHRYINNTRYYFISLPYDCNMSDVTFADGTPATYGVDWIAVYYDGAKRVTNYDNLENKPSWTPMPNNGTLEAGIGYNIAVSSETAVKLRFPNAAGTAIDETQTSPVIYHTRENTPAVNYGWNLVGHSYLSKYNGTIDMSDASALNYVSIFNGTTYDQVEIADATLLPFVGFFVQVLADANVEYGENLLRSGAPAASPAPRMTTAADKRVVFALSGEGIERADKTTLLFNDRYTTDYEIGSDLQKMLAKAGVPQIYTTMGGVKHAFQALNEPELTALTLGYYAPQAGEYSIALNEGTADYETVYLHDNLLGIQHNMELGAYNFTVTAAEENPTRFSLSVQSRVVTDNDNVENETPYVVYEDDGIIYIEGINENVNVRVYSAVGQTLYDANSTSSTMTIQAPQEGVYLVQLRENGAMETVKVIVKL